MMAIIYAGKPLTMSQIAREAKIPRQLVNYHIPRLIGSGLMLPVKEDGMLYYSAQPFIVNHETSKELQNHFEAIVKTIGESIIHLDKNHTEDTMKNNIVLFLKMLEILV